MKKKIYLVFTILISILMFNIVNAESILTYDKTYEYGQEIEYLHSIVNINEKLYLLTSGYYMPTKIFNPNEDFTDQVSKEFPDITNPTLINYNNKLLLIGIEKNTLKVYLLDENLQIKNQKETTYMIDNDATIKAYYYNDSVYLMLYQDETLINTNIYEIDSNLNVTEKTLSSYDSNLIKKVLKGDYYIIRMNDTEENDRLTHYNDTAYSKDYNILIGYTSNITYNEENGYDEKSLLTILDQTGKKVLVIENEEYTNFLDVEMINNKIVILAIKDSEEQLLIYDTTGKLEDNISLETMYQDSRMVNKTITKINDKLIIHAEELVKLRSLYQTLSFYNFNLTITANESLHGNIEVIKSSKPNEEVTIKITTNEGYEVDNIEIIDNQGNIIEVKENKFIMPQDDVYITVNYKTIIDNPETVDIIFYVGLITIIGIAFILVLFKRFKWLK